MSNQTFQISLQHQHKNQTNTVDTICCDHKNNQIKKQIW